MTRHIVVIGAGIVGSACAVALAADGHRVTLVEPEEPGGRHAASHGNGAWISPASVVPMSMPGLWRKVPGYLRDPSGPFTIRPAALPGLLPWLIRFLWAGATEARAAVTAAHLRSLLESGPERHAALAEAAGVPELIARTGLLYVFRDRASFEAEAASWSLRRAMGVTWREIEAAELREREPDLDPGYRFAILVEAGAHCRDTGAFVAALVRHAGSLGTETVRTRATGFTVRSGRLAAVLCADREIAADGAVVAAGIGSKALARAAGDRVSLVAERGYNVVVASHGIGPRTPMMPSDGKMANTPTLAGLRAAGQVELAGPDDPPDWRRAEILLAHLRRTFSALPQGEPISRWMGHRPSTPDGLPVIGPSAATPDIVHAFGHGHVGFAGGPITGAAVAALFGGRAPPLALAAFAPSRFGWLP